MAIKTAFASLVGISHRKLFYNNQDAYKIISEDNFTVGVVCDGCGSHINSEIGAKMTAEFVANYCLLNFKERKFDGKELSEAVVEFYKSCAQIALTQDTTFIKDTFFTTIIGFILSEKQNITFSAGDGVIACDSEIQIIDQDNMPKYLAYNLLQQKNYGFEVKEIKENFFRLLISTDGLEDLWINVSQKQVLEELFSPEMFRNEIELSKFLAKSDIYDDTTLILVQKI